MSDDDDDDDADEDDQEGDEEEKDGGAGEIKQHRGRQEFRSNAPSFFHFTRLFIYFRYKCQRANRVYYSLS